MRIQNVNNNQNQYKQNFEGYYQSVKKVPLVKTGKKIKQIGHDILTIATGKDTRVIFGEGGC